MAVARLSPAAFFVSAHQTGVELLGAIDGLNTSFTTPDDFEPSTLAVFYNGQRLKEGALDDYIVSESGGAGTGFDTIITTIAPKIGDRLLSDYLKQGA